MQQKESHEAKVIPLHKPTGMQMPTPGRLIIPETVQQELNKQLELEKKMPLSREEKIKRQYQEIDQLPADQISEAKKSGIKLLFIQLTRKHPKMQVSQALRTAGRKFGIDFAFDQQQ